MPRRGDVFTDVRGDDRTMRVSYHHDREVVVVSLWAGPVCRGSFRMAATEVDRLIATLGEMRVIAEPPPPAGDPAAPTLTTPTPEERPGPAHFSVAPVVPRPQVA